MAGHSRSLLSHFGHVTVVNLYRAMAAEWREAHAILDGKGSHLMSREQKVGVV